MKGAVVYFSRYGNCKKVAEEISRGLTEAGHVADLLDAKESELPEGLDFIVVGSPTRVGKMAGPVRKFIKKGISEDWRGKPFAAFGTGLKPDMEKGKSQSAEDVDRALNEKGLKQVCPMFKAGVEGMKGPLGEGDPERAFQFGKDVGVKLQPSSMV